MTETDTSSYRMTPPPTAMETLGAVQQNVSRAIGIDKQKLDLANQGYTYLIRELNSLPADANADKLREYAQNGVKLRLVTPAMAATFIAGIPSDPTQIAEYRKTIAAKLASTQEAVNFHYGVPGYQNNQNTIQPIMTSPLVNGGAPRPSGAPIQIQEPPTSEVTDTNELLPNGQPNPNYGNTQRRGPQVDQVPAGTMPVPGGLPGQYQQPQPQRPQTRLPVSGGPIAAGQPGSSAPMVPRGVPTTSEPPVNQRLPVSPQQTPNQVVQNRFAPAGSATSLPPGEREALISSAGSVAKARDQSANFQREVFPLHEAIVNLERLGTTGTGPGSETFNNIKSFLISNIPGIDPNDPAWSSVQAYDKAKKYLQDYVNQSGISAQSVNHLAAAMSGNPSTTISNAAATDVAKAALALRRMKQAEYIAFQQTGLPDNRFTRWSATWGNTQDPRAYAFDLLGQQKADALLKSMNQRDLAKFMASYEAAKSANVFNRGNSGH